MNIDPTTYNKATPYPPDGNLGYGTLIGAGSAQRTLQDIKSIIISIVPFSDQKIDPSTWNDALFNQWHDQLLQQQASLMGPYSPQSALLATSPNIHVPQVVASLAALPDQSYTATDIHLIMNCYQYYGVQVGIDWVLAFAQCLVETDYLRSWWVQRPHRNPAGLGVTGETQVSTPVDVQQWVQAADGTWHKGWSFPSWDRAVLAHLAHLLCYALADSEMTRIQLAVSAQSPCKHLIPASYRGVAKQLIDLNGRWAVPGTTYAQTIAEVANMLVGGGRG